MEIETIKNIIRTIKVICLINIICCLPLIMRNRKVINVDGTNRTIIKRNLENHMDVKNTNFIRKVSYGREWDEGLYYVYYWNGKVDDLLIYEGLRMDYEWTELWENSYQERDIGLLVGGTSLVILIIFRKLREK